MSLFLSRKNHYISRAIGVEGLGLPLANAPPVYTDLILWLLQEKSLPLIYKTPFRINSEYENTHYLHV